VDIQGNEGRIWVSGSTARATAKMTAVADSELQTAFRFSDRSATSYLRVGLRSSGATGANAMPDGYRVEIRSDSTTGKVLKEIGGAVTTLGTFTYPADTNSQRLRFRVQGSDLKVKLWATSEAEPAAWTWQGTDTSITAPGVVQLVHSHTNGTRAVYLDDLTIKDLATPTLRYEYHPDGNLWRYHDGAGEATTYGYDPLGRQTTVTDPLNRTTTFGYDPAGRLIHKQDHGGDCAASPRAGCSTMSYDDAGQLTAIDYSDPATPDVTNIIYDDLGRRTAMTDGTGTSTWSWDSLGRLTTATDGASQIVSHGYDRRSNRTSITYPGSTGTVTRTFDDAGRLSKVTDWAGRETLFGYDRNGFLTTQTYPNGTTATATPDAAGRPTGINHAGTTTPSTPFAAFSYGRDNLGQISSVSTTGIPADNHTYGYTPLNQIKTDNSGTYTYHKADNLARFPSGANLAHDPGNQITSITANAETTTFAYDNRGNRTSITPPTGAATSLTYDQANRLTGHDTADATYTYNGNGLRTAKTIGGTGGTTTAYTWDTAANVPLLLTEGTTNYTYGPGGFPLAQITSTGTVTYYHYDQLGSTRALTNAAGTVTATYTYDPYGSLAGSTGTATNPFRYAGQYTDPETGYQYLRARYYDPSTGVFLTRDPLETQTREAYGYAGGNPLNRTDPTGQNWFSDRASDLGGAIAGAADGAWDTAWEAGSDLSVDGVVGAVNTVSSYVSAGAGLCTAAGAASIIGAPVAGVCGTVGAVASVTNGVTGAYMTATGEKSIASFAVDLALGGAASRARAGAKASSAFAQKHARVGGVLGFFGVPTGKEILGELGWALGWGTSVTADSLSIFHSAVGLVC
jgi:RHS repeat-associated protein